MDEPTLICSAYVGSVLPNHYDNPCGIELLRPLFPMSCEYLRATLAELTTNFASEPVFVPLLILLLNSTL